jgi:hypothetical protein
MLKNFPLNWSFSFTIRKSGDWKERENIEDQSRNHRETIEKVARMQWIYNGIIARLHRENGEWSEEDVRKVRFFKSG